MPAAARDHDAELHLGDTQAMLRQLQLIAQLLDKRGELTNFAPGAVLLTDDQRAVTEIHHWPMKDGRRYLVGREGFGLTAQLAANQPAQLVREDSTRIGGLISVPAGGAAVTLYLARLETVQANPNGIPQIALGAGGQWNFMLGGALWGGNVTAVSVAGGPVSVAVC